MLPRGAGDTGAQVKNRTGPLCLLLPALGGSPGWWPGQGLWSSAPWIHIPALTCVFGQVCETLGLSLPCLCKGVVVTASSAS